MLDYSSAKISALEFIRSKYGQDCMIDEDRIIEKNHIFVFHYTSPALSKFSDYRELLLAPGPCVIDKENGSITEFSSAFSDESAINDYCYKNGYLDDIQELPEDLSDAKFMSQSEIDEFLHGGS